MHITKTILLASILAVLTFQSASASRIKDYKCNGGDMVGPMRLVSVGLGSIDDGYDQGEVVFCSGSRKPGNCYVSKYSVTSSIGRADYATLLTAFTLQKKVRFYCGGKKAENIHMLHD